MIPPCILIFKFLPFTVFVFWSLRKSPDNSHFSSCVLRLWTFSLLNSHNQGFTLSMKTALCQGLVGPAPLPLGWLLLVVSSFLNGSWLWSACHRAVLLVLDSSTARPDWKRISSKAASPVQGDRPICTVHVCAETSPGKPTVPKPHTIAGSMDKFELHAFDQSTPVLKMIVKMLIYPIISASCGWSWAILFLSEWQW